MKRTSGERDWALQVAMLMVCAVLSAMAAARLYAQAGAEKPATSQAAAPQGEASSPDDRRPRQDLMASLTIFVLAIFVGFEVITKVPPILHTPLMSGSNAISGITLVGAVWVAGTAASLDGWVIGFLAVALATINVVGGFLVTHRMLMMFKSR